MEDQSKRVLLRERLKQRLQRNPARSPVSTSLRKPESVVQGAETCIDVCFASSGIGVVDVGASKSVIGEDQLRELFPQLPEEIRLKLRRSPCNLVFRFGHRQTLTSRVAIQFPLRDSWFPAATVKGKTPFLLSSSFLKSILRAVKRVESNFDSQELVFDGHQPIVGRRTAAAGAEKSAGTGDVHRPHRPNIRDKSKRSGSCVFEPEASGT